MSERDRYRINKRLDEPARYFGLTSDEFIPILSILAIVFFSGHFVMGMGVSFLVGILLRYFKKGQSRYWLLNTLYWYFPDFIFRGVLYTKTPPSCHRFFMK